jgi:hypothetical protein
MSTASVLFLAARRRLWNVAGSLAGIFLGTSIALAQPAAQLPYADVVTKEANWIANQSQASCATTADGAIGQSAFASSGTRIVDPYRGNYAALGLLAAGSTYFSNVERWATWYMTHINWPDNLGFSATIYWYDVDPVACTETPSTTSVGRQTPGYDSTDAWAATYLTLIAAWSKAQPLVANPFIQKWHYQLDAIANAAYATHQTTSGLTGATHAYPAQYTMDNSEVAEGLNSYVWIAETVLQDQNVVDWWAPLAQGINSAIQASLWVPCGGSFYCDAYGDSPHTWVDCLPIQQPTQEGYANYEYFWDSGLTGEAQVWPTLSAVTPDNAGEIFGYLNLYCPSWKTAAGLPSASTLLADSAIALAAALHGDSADATVWMNAASTSWMVNHPWPWTVLDAGNTIRTANLLDGGPDPVP